ncbi:hypothetical protein P7H62_03695 [Vagococcus carniphilus]|uniref:hypothetical protein n=1 Tax=Vagococcus carniphilus TaxID=218144 RepID=UPI002890BE0A|nr:hypothetical protein [Vagococcus carniphilus]MDT2830273.1 hypothetical protein [Vagococcus carniphilus]MDT2838705.1 hypothetical protein [Vagococcus carniphilus]MDT2853543.1 hypothetical protein [Vagococcus carniphilus]
MEKRDIMVMHEVENDLGVKCEVYTNKDNVKYYSNVRCKIVISNLNEEINDKETLELLEKLGFSVSYLEEELYIENGECMRNSENDSSVITVDDYYILYTSHSIDKVEIYLKIALNVDGYCSYWVSLYEELFNTYKESMRKSDWYLECKRKWDGEVEYNYKGISKNEKYQLLSEKKKEEIKGFFSDHLFDNYVEEYIEFDAELLGADIADDSLKPTDDFYDEDEENLKSIIENIVRSHIEVFIDNVLTDTITGNIYVYI